MGSMAKTLHWSSGKFFSVVKTIFSTPSQERKFQFLLGSNLDDELHGVMDVVFAASCFPKPDVAAMGQMFWIFAKALLRVYVSSTDELNFLLWGNLLPQTVLFLAPTVFYLDSLIPPIETVLTIEGSMHEDESRAMTEIKIHCNGTLIFRADTRIIGVFFHRMQSRPNGVDSISSMLSFIGKREAPLNITLTLVKISKGGVLLTKCGRVWLQGVSVFRSIAGFLLETVDEFVFNRYPVSETDTAFKDVGIFNCNFAFSFHDVKTVELTHIRVHGVENVFSGSVLDTFLMSTSCIDSCASMGNLLMISDIRPVFQSVMVKIWNFLVFVYHHSMTFV